MRVIRYTVECDGCGESIHSDEQDLAPKEDQDPGEKLEQIAIRDHGWILLVADKGRCVVHDPGCAGAAIAALRDDPDRFRAPQKVVRLAPSPEGQSKTDMVKETLHQYLSDANIGGFHRGDVLVLLKENHPDMNLTATLDNVLQRMTKSGELVKVKQSKTGRSGGTYMLTS